MKSVRHLFWDFDGTLYNSYPQIAGAMRQALSSLGLECGEAPNALEGLLKRSVYQAACHFAKQFARDPREIMEAFHFYHDREGDFPPYEGMADCLKRLQKTGYRHYLYTHRNQKAVDQLKRDGLWRCFTDGVTRLDGYPDKPAPDALLALMARNAVLPNAAAMIGDREIDIQAGHNAGMAGILFDPDGYYPGAVAEMRVTSMANLCAQLTGAR